MFATLSRDQWCHAFEGTESCFAPVLSLDEAPQHPHLKARGILATGLYRLRFVTHIDVDAAGVDRAVEAVRGFFRD